MYTYIVKRTQIYLTEAEDAALEALSKSSGRTKSQLIREAIERAYMGASDHEARLAALRSAAGAWRGEREAGAAYVERLRGGRLARLHGSADE